MGKLLAGYGLKGRNFDGNNNTTWEVDFDVMTSGYVLNSDVRLSNARPASDVYAWAKASVKPTYNYSEVGAASVNDERLSDARTPLSHVHGNISNGGTIGSVSGLPLITTASGAVTTGAFGTTASSFCVGNDARLSDDRTPLAHTHGSITNVGAIGATANLPIITGASGALTTGAFGAAANSFCQGNDARLSDTRTPKPHAFIDTTGHTASGLTVRHVLRATGNTTYAFGAIQVLDVPTLNQDTTGQAGSVAQSLTIGTGLTSTGTYNGSVARTVAINYAINHTFSETISVHRLLADDGLFKGQLEANVFVKNSINVVSGDLRVAPASKLTAAITAATTSIPVVDGAVFAITDICSIDGELVRVTNIVTNTLTVTRAFGGTTGVIHVEGSVVVKLGAYNTANKGYVQIDGQDNVVEVHNFSTTTSEYTDTKVAEFGKLSSVPVIGYNGRFGVYADVAFFGNTTNYMGYKDGLLTVKGNIIASNQNSNHYLVDFATYGANLNLFFTNVAIEYPAVLHFEAGTYVASADINISTKSEISFIGLVGAKINMGSNKILFTAIDYVSFDGIEFLGTSTIISTRTTCKLFRMNDCVFNVVIPSAFMLDMRCDVVSIKNVNAINTAVASTSTFIYINVNDGETGHLNAYGYNVYYSIDNIISSGFHNFVHTRKNTTYFSIYNCNISCIGNFYNMGASTYPAEDTRQADTKIMNSMIACVSLFVGVGSYGIRQRNYVRVTNCDISITSSVLFDTWCVNSVISNNVINTSNNCTILYNYSGISAMDLSVVSDNLFINGTSCKMVYNYRYSDFVIKNNKCYIPMDSSVHWSSDAGTLWSIDNMDMNI